MQAPHSGDDVMRIGKEILNTLQWSQKQMATIQTKSPKTSSHSSESKDVKFCPSMQSATLDQPDSNSSSPPDPSLGCIGSVV